MSKHLKILLVVALALMVAAPAMAMKFDFHGDLNNRFLLYTDQAGWFTSSSSATVDEDDRPDSFAEIKYRLWTTASTDDGAVKGVFAIEVGGVNFGEAAKGGGFSGDGTNIETRWFYTDFQIPSIESKARVQMGLFSNTVNKFFWSETVTGVKFYTDNWYLAWIRGSDTFQQTRVAGVAADWGDGDLDSINARYDLKMEPFKVGFFVSYLWEDITAATSPALPTFPSPFEIKLLPAADFDLLAIGVDGGWSTATNFGKVFVNWDLIYETGGVDDVGSVGNDFDLSAYLLHGDFGLNFGKTTVTYTVWYASGDDNSSDKDLDNFVSVDVDFFESFIFQESIADDNAFFEGPYVSDKGLFFNKLALDYAANKKTKIGIAAIYHLLAEDITLATGKKEDALGVEINAYGKYKLYDNVELALHLGYLISDDAMDVFEESLNPNAGNGSGDVDIFKSEARVRFKF